MSYTHDDGCVSDNDDRSESWNEKDDEGDDADSPDMVAHGDDDENTSDCDGNDDDGVAFAMSDRSFRYATTAPSSPTSSKYCRRDKEEKRGRSAMMTEARRERRDGR